MILNIDLYTYYNYINIMYYKYNILLLQCRRYKLLLIYLL